jgi:hypothetical protein
VAQPLAWPLLLAYSQLSASYAFGEALRPSTPTSVPVRLMLARRAKRQLLCLDIMA